MAARPLATARWPSPRLAVRPRALRRLAGRVAAWLWRYLPSELAGTLAGLLCAGLSAWLGGERAAAAVCYTWGEGLAYYSLMLARELRRHGRPALACILRDMAIEFGPAEALDALLLRPAALFAGMSLAASPALGLLAGKLCADITFYLPAITCHELLRRARPAREELSNDC